MSDQDAKAFRAWNAEWWRVKHPHGGGEPPTMQEAFVAGMRAGEKVKTPMFKEADDD